MTSERLHRVKRLVLIAVVGSLAAGCGAGPDPLETSPTATVAPRVPPDHEIALGELASARQLWQTAAPADYTVTDAGGEILAVHAGDIVSLAAATQQTTVAGTFDQIEKAIQDGGLIKVSYDPTLGYPTTVVIDHDGDGLVDIDHEFSGLAAMPIVVTREALVAAKEKWDALGIDSYRYVFRADCTCADGGTFEVGVRNGSVADSKPLDLLAEESSLVPGTIEEAFTNLEHWFVDSTQFVADGLLAIDVRMDPELGYPRWFHIEAEDIDEDTFAGRFTIVVTIDLLVHVESLDEDTIDPGPSAQDLGTIEATVFAGPQCPVEQFPPDPACADLPVVGAEIVITRPSQDVEIRLTVAEDGTFSIAVEPGDYNVTPQPVVGLLGTAAPVEVVVEAGRITKINLPDDTGNR